MGTIAAIGAELAVRGFGLAGVLALPAEDAEETWVAWGDLPDDVDVVILTATAAGILGPATSTVQPPLMAVLPV